MAINTKFVESLFPYDMAYVLMISRCRAEALHNDWNAYVERPALRHRALSLRQHDPA